MEKSVYSNGLFEFVETEEEHLVNNNKTTLKRTFVRRSPGIRALIINKDDNKKILLSKEFRYELDKWDYRLPGGKVFDSLEDYKESLEKGDILKHVEETVPKEVLEEVGIIVKDKNLIKVSHAGASVVWDLYYYEINDYEISYDGPKLEENEFVDGYVWKTYDEIIDMCTKHEINEDRTVGVLLSYILNKKDI